MVRRETWDMVVLKRKILTVSMFVIEEKKKNIEEIFPHISEHVCPPWLQPHETRGTSATG